MLSNMWHVTCDMWQIKTFLPIMLHIFGFLITSGVYKSIQYVTSDKWHVTCDMWHVTCDMWHVTCDMWQVNTCLPIMLHIFEFLMAQGVHKSIQYVTCDMWHVTCDMWHVTKNNCFTHHVAYFWIHYNPRSSQEYTTCDSWQPVDVLSSPVIFSLDSLKGLESIE